MEFNNYCQIINTIDIDMNIYNRMNETEQERCKEFINDHYDYRNSEFKLEEIDNGSQNKKYLITCVLCNRTKDITDYDKINN